MEPCVALHVPLAALDALARGNPEGARAFGVLVNANMAVMTAAVSDLLIPRPDRRIAAVLLRVAGVSAVGPAAPHLSQADLAEMANASRQLVNRTLAGFVARGWVAQHYRRIAIRDPAALAAFANAADEA
jgi:CRP-like cAMP-binding protein